MLLSSDCLHVIQLLYPCHPEKAMAPHSSTLAWKIPGTGEPGGLPSMGSQSGGKNFIMKMRTLRKPTNKPTLWDKQLFDSQTTQL